MESVPQMATTKRRNYRHNVCKDSDTEVCQVGILDSSDFARAYSQTHVNSSSNCPGYCTTVRGVVPTNALELYACFGNGIADVQVQAHITHCPVKTLAISVFAIEGSGRRIVSSCAGLPL